MDTELNKGANCPQCISISQSTPIPKEITKGKIKIHYSHLKTGGTDLLGIQQLRDGDQSRRG
jgi:hypothetical protein